MDAQYISDKIQSKLISKGFSDKEDNTRESFGIKRGGDLCIT